MEVARRSRASLLGAPALTAVAGIIGAAALHLRDPHQDGSWGTCPFLALTGLPCPGCGGLRAVNDLTRGDVVAALSSNAVAVVVVVLLAAGWMRWTARRARGQDVRMVELTPTAGWAALGVLAVFGVLRLTPWGAWLAP